MSQPARVYQMLDALDRRERLYRKFGLHDFADQLVTDTGRAISDYRQAFSNAEAKVTPVPPSVGIYKGGL